MALWSSGLCEEPCVSMCVLPDWESEGRPAAMSHSVPNSQLSLFPHASPPGPGAFGLEIAAENHQIIDPRIWSFLSYPVLPCHYFLSSQAVSGSGCPG